MALRYVELNPVRALMADSPQEYKWSSAKVHLGMANAGDRLELLDRAFWETMGGPLGWRDLLQIENPPALDRLLRRCTYGERPFGDEQFVRSVEREVGREWPLYVYDQALRDEQVEYRFGALFEAGMLAGTERTIPEPVGTVSS